MVSSCKKFILNTTKTENVKPIAPPGNTIDNTCEKKIEQENVKPLVSQENLLGSSIVSECEKNIEKENNEIYYYDKFSQDFRNFVNINLLPYKDIMNEHEIIINFNSFIKKLPKNINLQPFISAFSDNFVELENIVIDFINTKKDDYEILLNAYNQFITTNNKNITNNYAEDDFYYKITQDINNVPNYESLVYYYTTNNYTKIYYLLKIINTQITKNKKYEYVILKDYIINIQKILDKEEKLNMVNINELIKKDLYDNIENIRTSEETNINIKDKDNIDLHDLLSNFVVNFKQDEFTKESYEEIIKNIQLLMQNLNENIEKNINEDLTKISEQLNNFSDRILKLQSNKKYNQILTTYQNELIKNIELLKKNNFKKSNKQINFVDIKSNLNEIKRQIMILNNNIDEFYGIDINSTLYKKLFNYQNTLINQMKKIEELNYPLLTYDDYSAIYSTIYYIHNNKISDTDIKIYKKDTNKNEINEITIENKFNLINEQLQDLCNIIKKQNIPLLIYINEILHDIEDSITNKILLDKGKLLQKMHQLIEFTSDNYYIIEIINDLQNIANCGFLYYEYLYKKVKNLLEYEMLLSYNNENNVLEKCKSGGFPQFSGDPKALINNKYCIDKHNPYYNDNTFIRYNHPFIQTKNKISEIRDGIKCNLDTKNKSLYTLNNNNEETSNKYNVEYYNDTSGKYFPNNIESCRYEELINMNKGKCGINNF